MRMSTFVLILTLIHLSSALDFTVDVQYPWECSTNQTFDPSAYACAECGSNRRPRPTSVSGCECAPGFVTISPSSLSSGGAAAEQSSSSWLFPQCHPCSRGQVPSREGDECIGCSDDGNKCVCGPDEIRGMSNVG